MVCWYCCWNEGVAGTGAAVSGAGVLVGPATLSSAIYLVEGICSVAAMEPFKDELESRGL